jgi:hypothetical protein
VEESARDAARFGLFLGDTALLRSQDIDLASLQGWSYVHKAVGRDILIAGRDHSTPAAALDKDDPLKHHCCDRIGTAKGVVDFLYQYAGVRFLYPEQAPRQELHQNLDLDLLASPGIEFLPVKRIAVPADLNVTVTPQVSGTSTWFVKAAPTPTRRRTPVGRPKPDN